jgi:hypothetical protein
MKYLAAILFTVAALLLPQAASATPSIVGLWACPPGHLGLSPADQAVQATIGDNRYSFGSNGSAMYWLSDNQTDSFKGTYTYHDGKLKMALDELGKTTVIVDTITWTSASMFRLHEPGNTLGDSICTKIS